MLYELDGHRPELLDNSCWVAPNAAVMGRVRMGAQSSVWFGCTLRGDNELIDIGSGTNIQDGSVLHTDPGAPITISENVTVGHQVMLHGCQIGEGSLIGMGSTILNRASIGAHSLVGAGSLITEGKVFEDGMLIMGRPAKAVRPLTDDEKAMLQQSAQVYIANAARFATGLKIVSE